MSQDSNAIDNDIGVKCWSKFSLAKKEFKFVVIQILSCGIAKPI